LASAVQLRELPDETCFISGADDDYAEVFGFDKCMKRVSGKRNILLVGDSLAAYAWVGVAANEHLNVMLNTVTGCQPVVGLFPGFGKNCERRNVDILENIERYSADDIVLMGNWRMVQMDALGQMLKRLREMGQNVIVVGPTLRFSKNLIDIVTPYRDVPAASAAARRFIPEEMFELDRAVSDVARQNGAQYFSAVEKLCKERNAAACEAILEGRYLVSRDQWHLLKPAAKILFRNFL